MLLLILLLLLSLDAHLLYFSLCRDLASIQAILDAFPALSPQMGSQTPVMLCTYTALQDSGPIFVRSIVEMGFWIFGLSLIFPCLLCFFFPRCSFHRACGYSCGCSCRQPCLWDERNEYPYVVLRRLLERRSVLVPGVSDLVLDYVGELPCEAARPQIKQYGCFN